MKDNKQCKIIQDLLPNYIENLTNDKTNNFIEEHLRKCEDCNYIYRCMNEKININLGNMPKKEIDFFKKYNRNIKKIKYFSIIMIILLLLLFTFSLYKMTILSSLTAKETNYKYSQNFHQHTEKNTENYTFISDYYKKGNNVIIYDLVDDKKTMEQFKRITIQNDLDTKLYYEIGKEKYWNNYDISYGVMPVGLYFDYSTLWNTFITMQNVSIKKSRVNDKECYIINCNLNGILVSNVYKDMETGLTIKYGEYEYQYEFETVSDKIFTQTNLDDYILIK